MLPTSGLLLKKHAVRERKRMFKLQRPTSNKPSKPKQRVNFKFSNFQALQVPKGWDRLFVSIVCVETGKTMAKLGKALVKNGSCQWTEALSESIYLTRSDDSSKGYEECLFKLLVSTGSTRSSPLGEVIVDMSQYTSSRVSTAFSQPLKKCSYGTILQVKIQCSNPRSKIGEEESKNNTPSVEKDRNVDLLEKDRNVDPRDADSKSYGLENSRDTSVGPPSEDLGTTSRPMKLDSKEASQSASSVASQSFDSVKKLFRKNALKSEDYEYNSHERSYEGSPIPDYLSVDNVSPSNQSSSTSRLYSRHDFQSEQAVNRYSATSYLGSSKNLLEAAEDTIAELRVEAKMWERNARKLMIDLDVSRKEFSDLSKKEKELVIELSAEHAENDGLKKEVEKLQKLNTDQAIKEDSVVQSEGLVQIQKVLENEIKYQQDLNNNLDQQLKRSQESNIELVSVLQELEETIEQQRIEIENLSSLKLEFAVLESSIARKSEDNSALLLKLEALEKSEMKLQGDVHLLNESVRDKTEEFPSLEATLSGYVKGEHFEALDDKNENNVDLVREIESLREKVRELEKDCTELTDENLELLFKLKESNKTDMRKCASFDSMSSEHPNVCPSDDSEVSDRKFQISHLEEELKKKVEEEQNAGLLGSSEISKQMDSAFALLMKPWFGTSYDTNETCNGFLHGLMSGSEGNTITNKMSAEYILSFLQELNKLLEMRVTESGKILADHEIEIKKINEVMSDATKKMEESILEVEELEKSKAKGEEKYANLMKELDEKRLEIDLVEANLLSKVKESNFLSQNQKILEDEVSELQQEKIRLEQNFELALREKNISSESMENLQNDLMALRSSVSSHVSANENLERDLEMLEMKRRELENTLSRSQEENMQLHECISGLETQVRQLKEENETLTLALEEKLEEMQKQWLSAQKECESLKEEKKNLEANFVQDSMKLQNSNSELERANQELHENCSVLVAQLSESKKSLSDCSRKVELLENRLTSVLDDFEVRENILNSQLDALVKENSSQKEKTIEEYELRVEDLTSQLVDSKRTHERLMADNDRISKSLSGYKRSEEKLNTDLNDIELKLTISDYERQQLTKETSSLKVQLQSLSVLREEISTLKSELNDSRVDKCKLEHTLKTISGEYEELKAENISFSEKVSMFEDAIFEFEECKRNKLALEEKLLQMEKELSAKEILCVRNTDLENELTEIKRMNVQFQQKMYQLEEESEECLKKAQSLEENLKLVEERNNNIHEEGAYNGNFDSESPLAISVDPTTKRQLFEYDVAEESDAYNKNRVLRGSGTFNSPKKSGGGGGVVARERYERTKSSFETELRELRERYLEMSLKYAEVETQREDLVMKLKANTGGKRWFS